MRMPGWMFLIGVVAFVAATAFCSVGAFVAARQFAVDLGSSGVAIASAGEFIASQPTVTPSLTPSPAPPTATPLPGETPIPPTLTPIPTLDPLAQYQWEDPRRINILLLGMDQRRGEEGAFRTDTMIVFSIDPVRKTVGMLSIPRDLWVQIPGYQPQRINTANFIGDGQGYPGGGPALAARTVTENLGIRIDKYLRVNFDVFTAVIDLIAPYGVEICPSELIDDPNYPDAGYGTIYVRFEPFCQRLDAERLLQYARTRATEGGDFDRAERQQEVIRAVRDEIVTVGGITNFLGQVPALYAELTGSFSTDLTLQELISLAALAQDIPRENIRSGVIGIPHTRPETTIRGERVLIPVHGALRSLFQEVFNTGGATTAEGGAALTQAELRERADAENARVVVFNNTQTSGLAGQTRDWLVSRGVRIADVGNMPTSDGDLTYIRDYTGKTWTARYVAQVLGISPDRIRIASSSDGLTDADVVVVAGSDAQRLIGGR